jgi:hypothetical protein
MKRSIISVSVFASVFLVAGVPQAQARHTRACSNALLQGGYGSTVGMLVLPAGTPRAVLLRFSFDGNGNFTNSVTINDNGTVTHATDFGTYQVNADCTGTIFTNGGTRTVEIVLVDGGKEFYSIRTDPPNLVFLFHSAKKQFPDDDEEDRHGR